MDKLPETVICFGSGGGFTGAISEYFLLKDGRIMVKNKDNNGYSQLAQVKSEKAEQCFENIKTFNLHKANFNEPGNLYFYLDVKMKGEADNKIVWGKNDTTPPNGVREIYSILNGFLPKKR